MSLKPPKPFSITEDGFKDWVVWKQSFEFFAKATGLDEKDGEVQVATFMSVLGYEAIPIFNSFSLTNKDKKDLKAVLKHFDDYFAPQKNIIYIRYKFNSAVQGEMESLAEFISRLKNLAQDCEFGSLRDELIRDKLVVGLKDESLREKLLLESQLTLSKAIEIARLTEQTKKQLELLHSKKHSIDQVIKPKSYNYNNEIDSRNASFKCRNCGNQHGPRQCPAYGKVCMKCSRRNHFAKYCRSGTPTPAVSSVDEKPDEEVEQHVSVMEIARGEAHDRWTVNVRAGNVNFKANIDSGAACNVLPKNIADNLKIPLAQSGTKRLVSYSKHCIDVLGEIELVCFIGNRLKENTIKFLVADSDKVSPILGAKTSEQIGLIKRVANADMLKEMSAIKDFIYDIDLVENPVFRIHSARRIPFAIRDEVKSELDKMVNLGVIKPVDKPTPVVSPLVIVRQHEKLRLCLDPTDVNKNLLRRHFPLKTLDEILAKLNGAKYFTKLDAEKGFWQIRVSERTQDYLTFATPWGRYAFTRLPFGLASAPEIFQKLICKILKDIPNTECAMDDIIIYAGSLEELRELTSIVKIRLEEAGLRLNDKKCEYEMTKIKFLGHIISSNGIDIDEQKIEAINQLQPPTNIKELRRLMGMLNYLSRFIPNYSDLIYPLRLLLKKNSEFVWTVDQKTAFENVKKVITTAPTLGFYDLTKPVRLSVDSSQHSIGAVLLQDRPIAYATRALSPTEQTLPQIVKEALAVQFGCKKFHCFIYGKPLTIETDHQPLETIFRKTLGEAPVRLQKIFLEVIPYNPKIVYIKGKNMHIADVLSRDCKSPENSSLCEENNLEVLSIFTVYPNNQLLRVKEETSKNSTLQELVKVIQKGWPSSKSELQKCLHLFWNFRDQLIFENGVVFKGTKIVIPKAMIMDVMKIVHTGHQGIQSCYQRARESLYWPNMFEDFTDYIRSCAVCQSQSRAEVKEPIKNKHVPRRPWEVTATDHFDFRGKTYLVLGDSYSGYFELAEVKSTSNFVTMNQLKSWFAIHGVPAIVESDNMPFNSVDFKNFATRWGFEQSISSPNFPRANGLAERFVQTAKNLLRRCHQDGTDIYEALLNYRNTPRSPDLGSPVQRLMSRRTQTLVPISDELLLPSIINPKEVHNNLLQAREREKMYADRGSKLKPGFEEGENVKIKKGHRNWDLDGVVRKKINERSYIVENKGNLYRRNSNHLAKVYQPKNPDDLRKQKKYEPSMLTQGASDRPRRIVIKPHYLKDFNTD